jgi:hypothetical protein
MGPFCSSIRPWSFALAAVALAALTSPPQAAAARRAVKSAEAVAARAAGAPIMAIVSLKSQHVTIYDADGWILRAPVSTGTKGRETPAGVFSVIQKEEEHYSNLYDDAAMPHMQRITWSGLALHGGPLPGRPASHGCIRMPYGFAERLFDKTRIGMRVIIAPSDTAPATLSHPMLITAKPDVPDRAAELAAAAATAAATAEQARLAAATAFREASRAAATVRTLEIQKRRAEAQFAAAKAALAAAASEQARAAGAEAAAKAEADVAELAAQWQAAKAELQPKRDAAALAREAATAAEKARAEAVQSAREAARAPAPVSVFISRKTQTLYVRRGFEPAFDSPVTIADPERPIGTHVYTALAWTDAGLKWSAVTLDGGQSQAVIKAPADKRRHGGGDAPPAAADADAARAALDRIVIPQDVRDRIAATISPRSSLIVSDEPLSRETGKGTEFVAVLSHQPQGSLIKRARAPSRGYGYAGRRAPFRYGSPFGPVYSAW